MLIEVCIGSSCHLKGAYTVIHTLQEMIEERKAGDRVEIKAVFCMENCKGAVAARIDGETVSINAGNIRQIFEEKVIGHL